MASITITSCHLYLLLLLSTSVIVPPSLSFNFNIKSFDPNSNEILYEGAAVPSVGVLELTDPRTLLYICQTGRAIYNKRVAIWSKETGQLTSFSSHFTFIVDTINQTEYGAGFTFFLAPVDFQIPSNSIGGFLGLYNTTTAGNSDTNQIVHVEFDSTVNGWDPPFEHVGINVNSITSAVTSQWNASLHSDETGDAWVTYDAESLNLTVFWAYPFQPGGGFRKNLTLSYLVDLRRILPEWCIIGFTGATGNLHERHKIISWEFSSTLEVNSPDRSSSKLKKIVKISVICAAAVVVMASCAGLVIYRKKRRIILMMTQKSFEKDDLRSTGPRSFTYNELAAATSNFSDNKKLGEGGFGKVYKGYMIDADMPIAVKRFSKESRQGRKEFVTEVKVISQLRHRNLVQLIGWCQDEGEFLLVYEFMPNGSLDFHLFGKNRSFPPLAWDVRYKISLGLASALIYLHEEWDQCVLHRDIKSSNIMLDSSFNVKLGDFGLARLMDHDILQRTSALAGTMGYMAPEYMVTRKASRQSDVYSFGVVVLELVTGKRSSDIIAEKSDSGTCCLSLLEWVWYLYGNGAILSGLDETLISGYDSKEAENLILVGLWCVHPDSAARPFVRQLIQALRFEATVPNLPAKMPVPVFYAPLSSSTNSNINPLTDSTSSYEIGR